MQNQVGAGVDSLSSGAEQLNGGIKQAKAGAENLRKELQVLQQVRKV